MSVHPESQHILATEDDSAVRAVLADLLDEAGYRVSFSSAQDIAEVAALHPDLILLDYWNASTGAPSGFLERLKTEQTTAAIPILLLTSAKYDADEQSAHFAAIDVTVMLKPFDIDALLAAVQERLGETQGGDGPASRRREPLHSLSSL